MITIIQCEFLQKMIILFKISPLFSTSPLNKESEKLIAELNETWEEKLKKTEDIRLQR